MKILKKKKKMRVLNFAVDKKIATSVVLILVIKTHEI